MGMMFLIVGVVLALAILVSVPRIPGAALKGAAAAFALLLVIAGLLLSSAVYVSADRVGIVSKNLFGASLKDGKIIAIDGEMGVQADVLPPGWHWGYWPIVYSVDTVALTEVPSDQVGLIEAKDGLPQEPGQLFAPEFKQAEFQKMLDARYFLTDGRGRKGPQSSVLTPGKYRLNTQLFTIQMVPQTEVAQGEVAVIKANFGAEPSIQIKGDGGEGDIFLAKEGEMGVRARPLPPGKYPLNTRAFTIVEMWTTQMIAHYAGGTTSNPTSGAPQRSRGGTPRGGPESEEREITVRTSDGFTFPVDVRIEYLIRPENAPLVVARLGSDEDERFMNALNSAVRAIFRNNAEGVRALDYVQQRSHQESQSLEMLSDQMARFGVTITAVRIGNVGDEASLGALLKTQTDREIAKQELITFQEQQKAAEQKKELSRATQEAEEEKRLATAAYAVKIAEEEQKRKVIEAQAEAEAIGIRAEAQALAYQQIALQIGKGNAALVELLKIVGERNIQITPRVLITGGSGGGGNGSGNSGETTALIGTMLDHMVSREEDAPQARGRVTPTSGGN